ncbi:LOW QUALITY PROTEIN: probable cytochrome P450 28a5 [Drosophila sulfurigaster albostrigata]|uniref:LOW QUALITY PROTEIN: probable cytochrome P450 28a5 n=1 Tax=Drosophila sulfurigaster albostrigata TaxID=89887 RepID=UPI002D2183A8|nr:LOW QUALITY PROTEIN: probable cytochrome P450 28a5 [Drosophila sulfurigaster albostrigata]
MTLMTFALLALLVALGYQYLTWTFGYWRKRKVPGPSPKPLTGNFPNMYTLKRHSFYDMQDIYRKYKQDYDMVGMFLGRAPQLLVLNPELAHRVFVADFKSFHDNELANAVDEKSDYILANNMFTMKGEQWKQRRTDITPGLTMSRIKTVYPVTNQVCNKLTEYIRKQSRIGAPEGINSKHLSLCYTSEMVTDCVLGLSAKSFTDNPTPIMDKMKNIFDQSFTFILNTMIFAMFPILSKIRKLRFIPKDIEKFFVSLVETAIDTRKQQLDIGKEFDRVDFLDYIMQLGNKHKLSTRQLAACSMTFLIDGFETTATVLAHALLFLARDVKIQQRLRDEIHANLNSQGFVDFEKLNELPFLDACVQETIRFFPPLIASNKLCTKRIELPNGKGPTVTIEPGTVVVVPHGCFMKDADYFTNPEHFQPDRFMEPNSAKTYRDRGVFMPFGDGPRICIGMRFALTQIKAAIVEVINNFDVKINPKTRKDNLIDSSSFLPKLQGDIWLDFEERK